MQEGTVVMSDEENSDTEITLLYQGQPSSTNQQLSNRERHVEKGIQNREKELDEQLKALGLYEDGLSIEQKQELLVVVAASRETAEQEAAMRVKAEEWQKKFDFPYEEIDSSNPQEQVDNVTEIASSSNSNDATSLMDSAPTKSELRLDVSVKENMPEQNSYSALEDDNSPEISGSLELFENSIPELAPGKNIYEVCQHLVNSTPSIPGTSKESSVKRPPTRRGRPRRSRAGCRGSLSRDTRSAFVHTTSSLSPDKLDVADEIQLGIRQQKQELDRFVQYWRPCTSPVSASLETSRIIQKDEQNVPYICGKSTCGQDILKSFEDYHIALGNIQRTSYVFIPWGNPITTAKPYATRSTRNRTTEHDTTNGIIPSQIPDTSDDVTSTDDAAVDHSLLDSDTWLHHDTDINDSSTVQTATSAFRPVKKETIDCMKNGSTNYDKQVYSSANSLLKITRSGMSYGDRNSSLRNDCVSQENSDAVSSDFVASSSMQTNSTLSLSNKKTSKPSMQDSNKENLLCTKDLFSYSHKKTFDRCLYSVHNSENITVSHSPENSCSMENKELQVNEMSDNEEKSESPIIIVDDSPAEESYVKETIPKTIKKRKRTLDITLNQQKTEDYSINSLKSILFLRNCHTVVAGV